MRPENNILLTEAEQQELIRAINASLEGKLAELFPVKSSMRKLSDFPEHFRPHIDWHRKQYVNIACYSVREMVDRFDEDFTTMKVPAAYDPYYWRISIIAQKDNWFKHFDLLVSLEYIFNKLSNDLNADLSEIPRQLRTELNNFKAILKILTKQSAKQFIIGLNKHPVGHPERDIYLRFWINSLSQRFRERHTQSTTLGMSCFIGHDDTLEKHTWENAILKNNILDDTIYWSTVQSLFLERYPWNILMTWESCQLFWSINAMPECARAWLIAYFNPVVQRDDYESKIGHALGHPSCSDTKRIEFYFDIFGKFYVKYLQLLEKFSCVLSSPPTFPISFTLNSDYLIRVNQVLEKSTKPELQIQCLNALPSSAEIEIAFRNRLNTILTEKMFIYNRLPEWVTAVNAKATVDKQKIILSEIDKISEFNVYQANILCFDSLYFPNSFIAIRNFFNELCVIPADVLSNEEKRIIASVVSIILQDEKSLHLLPTWIVLARRLRDEYGISLVEKILMLQPEEKSLDELIKIAELFLDLVCYFNMQLCLRKQTSRDSYRRPVDIFSKHKTISDVIACLKTLQNVYWEKRFPEKSYEQLRHDFLTVSDTVRSPLSENQLDILLSDCEKIDVLGKDYFGCSQITLGNKAKEITLQHPIDIVRLLAIIRECIRQEFGILPYRTQLLTVLGMIHYPKHFKGCIAQMKPGEGKSTVTTLLAAFFSCQGRFVDIITSNHSLAMRDQEKYKQFYSIFGISCSHICMQNPSEKDFDAQILFGTNTDFEFSILRDALRYTKNRYMFINGRKVPRYCDVVIVDEVDSLFIDNALQSARIANHAATDVSWVYQPILQLLKNSGEEKFLLLSNAELCSILSRYHNGHYAKQVGTFTETQLSDWKENSVLSLKKQEGNHYVVQDGSLEDPQDKSKKHIVLMNKNTGHLSHGTQWPGGLHQFIEIKHGIPPTPESNTIAAISHPVFFAEYRELYGLTGTIGEEVERSEIKTIYNVDIFDVPTHAPILRARKPGTITKTVEEQMQKIIASVKSYQNKGRSILILFNNINQTESFAKQLETEKIACLVLNEQQKEDERFVIARAGEPSSVTVATNMAGRGTDIILSSCVKEAGGLHVIFAFYPEDLRIEEQGFARAGRQAQLGSGEMILSLQDPMIQKLLCRNKEILPAILMGLFSGNFISILEKLRSAAIYESSAHRQKSSEQEKYLYQKLHFFFENLNLIDNALLSIDKKKLEVVMTTVQEALPSDLFLILPNQPILIATDKLITDTVGRLCHVDAGDKPISDSIVNYLRKAYFDLLLDRWARWYTEISHHRFRNLFKSDYAGMVEKQFQAFCNAGYASIAQNPLQNFYGWVGQIADGVIRVSSPVLPRSPSSSAFFNFPDEKLADGDKEKMILNTTREF